MSAPPGGTPSSSGGGPWMLLIVLSVFFLLIVVIVGGAVALRIGPFARPPGTPVPTTSTDPARTPISQPTNQLVPASDLPIPNPTERPVETDGATSPFETPSPDIHLGQLLSHIPEPLRASCVATGIEPPLVAATDCEADNGDISLSYALYMDVAQMDAAYDDVFRGAQIDADSGRCYDVEGETISAAPNKWPAEHGYSIGGQATGRYLCFVRQDVPTIVWTDDRYEILGIARARTDQLDRFVRFWLNEAGPVP